MYERFLKRLFDIAFAVLAILATSPAIILTGIAIALEDGLPCIFRQARVGQNLKNFTIFKFRSMPLGTKNIASKDAKQLTTTQVGKFIRRTNLDELPQLFNILMGDMSLVGPRPALASQESLVDERNRKGVYDLRPGLTGLAQVNSYENMPEQEKIKWDSEYRKTVSLKTDFSIILRTFAYVLKPPPSY